MKPEILARYADRPLPRYTSYPTAPHFGADVDAAVYSDWLGTLPPGSAVSLYLHVPFCRSMCWYCGCHTTITARDEPIARYLDALHREIALVADAIPGRLHAGHVHFGGGTPTLMQPGQFIALMDALRARFDFNADSEIAIEIDSRTLEPDMIAALGQGGVTRASLGVQSFDPVVQHAINRVQTYEQTAAATEGLRAAGVAGVNFDLIYGLPHQSVASCLETVAQAVSLAPDRFAVFGYAHVPSFKLHQRKIDEAALPDGAARHQQAEAIAAALVDAGYVRIGLDHFARPDDELARAFASGTLHRNFQGYTTDACDTLIGFGASSIGRLPQGYAQNAVLIGEYQRRIGEGRLATGKGRAFAAEDRLRAAVIERIMCDHRVDLAEVCAPFGASPGRLIDDSALDQLVADGIARRDDNVVVLADEARPLVRVLAAAFDQYLGQAPARHSRAV
ncbi:oxygen-independent coproporphyrinogen III oxidase [Sphingomonas sp. MAH-20]|uniref:Coproporphyrinogen-III oxidase n=1 Tax=Sphingomonas horti TaxID=2682842 RepID=A0A6I4J007_9SPHN|nr:MULTISPECIES: oxygen-independent coproporphyrinogen III oxidase [Sphingomonas]MBA2919977.1 oxygen-independent coproporphyrinogen III oxidase [Sphingomonas sp. CGMCC 1.13658]MVO77859.1 oxygen-independent coproporphyrinogen III oxidase [Sphingomonas horti]